jgi:hypothetical protein
MKAMLLASALAGCASGAIPAPPATIGNTAVPAAQASRDDVEAYLPADAVLVWYEAKAYVHELPLLTSSRCMKEARRLGGGFTAVRPEGGQIQYLLGTVDRDLLTGCLREALEALDPATQVTAQGDQTKLAGPYRSLWIAWHERFLAVGGEPFASPVTPPADERVATFRTMRRSQVAVWTTLPVVQAILGAEAKELLIQLDVFEMPQEWVRQVSGTITVQFGSSAAAAAAKAALAGGKIATLTDPKLVAALRGLPVEVAGATLRARLTDLTFSLRDLLDQLGPVLSLEGSR